MNNLLNKLQENPALIKSINHGIEKESLRASLDGQMSKLAHNSRLGSKLTHPSITTDYSENLMEFITPVHKTVDSVLDHLKELHKFTFSRNEASELIWPMSMPCIVPENESDIVIADYGKSNRGRLKTLYRNGLGYRYGKSMQSIAGVHYNFSLEEIFWVEYKTLTDDSRPLQDVIDDGYFNIIRNYRRYSWLLTYLFGASPVVDQSFLKDKKHQLKKLAKDSFGKEYATSLRMGGLGYTSNVQKEISLCFNNLNSYIETLEEARQTAHGEYEQIGLRSGDEYLQLNTNLLQIDNEFYSTIRPKNIANPDESALQALYRDGIKYIEVRILDVDPFSEVGISEESIRFLHIFLITCLLENSSSICSQECKELEENLNKVVNEGRKPNLELTNHGKQILLTDFANELFTKMDKITSILDRAYDTADYTKALGFQLEKVKDISKTPSAKIMNSLNENVSLIDFALNLAREYKTNITKHNWEEGRLEALDLEAAHSLQEQINIEQEDTQSFDDFLTHHFEQIKINFN